MHACMLLFLQEVRRIKNITLRVSDDFHYSVKTFAAKQGITLQGYMIDVIEKDLEKNKAYVKSPETIADIIDDLSEDELLQIVKQIKENKRNKK